MLLLVIGALYVERKFFLTRVVSLHMLRPACMRRVSSKLTHALSGLRVPYEPRKLTHASASLYAPCEQ